MFDAYCPTLASSDRSPPAAGRPATLAELAPAFGIDVADALRATISFPVRRLKAGEYLVRAGDRFDSLYVVRCGFCKTVRVDEAGNEVVLALPMGGETVGLDGVDTGRYTADVIALDTTHVAVVSFARLVDLARKHPVVERALFRAFSRELGREHRMIWLLSMLSAEARVATFLLDLSERFGRLGYSRTEFELRMTRQEIGSYLGLKLETVSRTFSALAAANLLAVDRRSVTVRDLAGLRRIAQPQQEDAGPGTAANAAHALRAGQRMTLAAVAA